MDTQTKKYLPPEKEAVFPNLRRENYHVTSCDDPFYNCIAYAAEVYDKWWWPVEADGTDWPESLPEYVTLEVFVSAFRTKGYSECNDNDTTVEAGMEKVAIYAYDDGEPTHAAKQLPSGTWSSKLGGWEDIEHATLEDLEGDDPAYGKVARVLKRPRS